MSICSACNRPLKYPRPSGKGPVCEAKSKTSPVPEHERDLFGYDPEKAVHAARYRVNVGIEVAAAEASMALRKRYQRLCHELLGWELRA